jgi:hypothetical protein
MRIAYLDCFSGITGDMFLGALVAAGVPIRLLCQTVAALDVGARLEMSPVLWSGVSAANSEVVADGRENSSQETCQPERGKAALQDISSGHADHEPARRFSPAQMRALIIQAPISPSARTMAVAMVEALGKGEEGTHHVKSQDPYLGEVGCSTDDLVDITCAAVGAEALGVDQWFCSPVNVGGGIVQRGPDCLAVPAPATLEWLRRRNVPIYSSRVEKELVTLTGAAIVTTLAHRCGRFPLLKVERIGYGAGSGDLPRHLNVVRLTLGEATDSSVGSSAAALPLAGGEITAVIEANLDDTTPQVIGYVIERALNEGALDIFSTPVQMKKNRPGLLVTVLCRPEDAERLARLLFAETTTLGIRVHQELRQCLPRRHVTVDTPWGVVRIKLGSMSDQVTQYAPEYDDCRRIALEHKIPLQTVMQQAVCSYLEYHYEE